MSSTTGIFDFRTLCRSIWWLAVIAALATCPFGANRAASGTPATEPSGAGLYQDHCAACHDHPGARTPPKSTIARNPADMIVNILTKGVMTPYAAGLSVREKSAIAAFVSNDRSSNVEETPLETPTCAGPMPQLSLTKTGWNGWGRTVENTRDQPNPGLATRDLSRLKLKWAMASQGSRNGQPVIAGDVLFTNDTAGLVHALNARTGCAYWRFKAEAPTRSTISLATLADAGSHPRIAAFFTDFSGYLNALDASTGTRIWRTLIDTQSGHQFTGSVSIANGVVYAPVASGEEAFATDDAYPCCRFRGALVAVAADTGKIIWTTYTNPKTPSPSGKTRAGRPIYGPAGAAIWSAPTIDVKRGVAYVGTGNSYTDTPNSGSDAVMAMDLKTGKIVWTRQLTAPDNYIIGCYGPVDLRHANCPAKVGEDFDIGASPTLTQTPAGRPVLLVSQKSGQVYALDPDAQGRIIWQKRLSVGGPLGGAEFGHASDAQNVYVGISDIYVTAQAAHPQITALHIADGAVVWTHPMVRRGCRWTDVYCNPGISMAVSVMPDAVFAGSMDGWLQAFSTSDGSLLWSVDTAQPVTTTTGAVATGGVLDGGGPVIAGGMVFIHSGYWGRSGPGSVLLAYSIDGK